MELQGILKIAIPFIPKAELESDKPTIFWIKPKTVGFVQKQELYETVMKEAPASSNLFSTLKLDEFCEVVEKVDNFEFSDSYPELHKLGCITVTKENFKYLLNELDIEIFTEVLEEVNRISHLRTYQYKIFELMTFFSLWKNDEMSLMERRSYSCDSCKLMKSYEGRYCFQMNEKIELNIPVIEEQEEFTGEWKVDEGVLKTLTADEFLEYFMDIHHKVFSDVPAFLAIQRLQGFASWDKELCITGVVKDEYIKIFNWALDCKSINVLPYSGGYTEQPNQLIAAFQAVNSSVSEFDKYKMDKATSKTSKKK